MTLECCDDFLNKPSGAEIHILDNGQLVCSMGVDSTVNRH
jgi:hypothetical protein